MISSTDIQAIMRYGGPVVLMIFLLLGAIVVLWKHYLTQVKVWTDSQIEDTKSMIEVTERSTSALANLTELLKSSANANILFQSEIRSKLDSALAEIRQLQMMRGGRR